MTRLNMMAALAASTLVFGAPALADQGTGEALAHGAWVPNSTNALNYAQQVPGREGQVAPYVYFSANGPGYVTLDFVNHGPGLAFFETRIDGVQTGATAHPVVPGDTIHAGGTSVASGTGDIGKQFSAAEYVDIRLALGGERDWDFDWTRFYVVPLPRYSCSGFEPPADRDIVVKKPNRALPLRMTLLDADGAIVYDIAPPVLSAGYQAEPGDTPADAGELDYAGRGDDGNMFMFDGTGWVFNLSTKGLAPGEYTISAVPGGAYAIDPGCEVVVTIQ